MGLKAIEVSNLEPNFKYEIAAVSGGEKIMRCYGCGTCSASCSVREIDEQYNPRRIIRMAILGMKKEVLESDFIWLCAGCSLCYERCPQDVRFVEVIHAIRNIALEEAKKGKIKIKSPGALFAKVFVNSIKAYGRVWEPELMGKFFLGKRDIAGMIGYMPLGIEMIKHGKLPFCLIELKG
ncbi:4Fe-4S dicluster domain-containing protein [bacterium]|nr:4Fe-4S dicluster domain-containing protein [bacterium]